MQPEPSPDLSTELRELRGGPVAGAAIDKPEEPVALTQQRAVGGWVLMGIEHRRASIRSLRRCFRPTSLLRDPCRGFGLLHGSDCGLLRDPCRGFGLLHGSDCGDAEHLVEAGGL